MSVSCASVAQVPLCTFRYGSRKSAIFVPYLGLSGWTLREKTRHFGRVFCQIVTRLQDVLGRFVDKRIEIPLFHINTFFQSVKDPLGFGNEAFLIGRDFGRSTPFLTIGHNSLS
jgi:hypothetical protein